MKITFYARGSVVQARISDGKDFYRLSTGIDIEPHHKFNGTFKGKTIEVAKLNAELSKCQSSITDLYLEHRDFKLVKEHFNRFTPELPQGETYLLHDLLRKYVAGMAKGELLSSSKRKYSKASVTLYKYVAGLLTEFSNYYRPLDLRDFHIDPTWESIKKREVADQFAQYWKKYESYLMERNLGVKSRSEVMNMTGVMAKYWADHLFFMLPKVPRLSGHERAIIVLPSDFVKKFLNDDDKVYPKLTPELRFVWELSATILITTLRIGDAMSLKENDFTFTRDTVFMRKKNEKTGVYSEMPLPPFLSNIYRDNLTRLGRIYSIEPNRDIVYDNIKVLFKMYDDMHETVSVAELDIKGNEHVVTKQLWEWVHPHLLRKTAITTMIYNKVPERFIKFASGHTTNSNAFERYVGHVEKYYKSEINDYYGKMFN